MRVREQWNYVSGGAAEGTGKHPCLLGMLSWLKIRNEGKRLSLDKYV